MKNARPLLVILISIVVGAVAVILAAQWVSRQAGVATTKVVVGAKDLEIGTRLRPEMLQVVEWPAESPLKESFSDPQKLYERVLNAQVLRGEPILAAKLAAPGEKGGLSAVLNEGKRAITVKVNEIVGVAGFALPGNYVDLMVNTADEANKSVSKIMLERILVLAVAQDLSTSETKPRVVNAVTLEVTPEQAEQIDLARSVGTISLVLRSQVDKAPSDTAGARKHDLLSGEQMAALGGDKDKKAMPVKPTAPVRKRDAAPSASAAQLEVIRGLRRTVE